MLKYPVNNHDIINLPNQVTDRSNDTILGDLINFTSSNIEISPKTVHTISCNSDKLSTLVTPNLDTVNFPLNTKETVFCNNLVSFEENLTGL